MVPRDTPGFRIGKVFNKRGWRFYQNAGSSSKTRACRTPTWWVKSVPARSSRARAIRPAAICSAIFELAANALGVCDDAVEMAMKHARAHKRAGKGTWSIS